MSPDWLKFIILNIIAFYSCDWLRDGHMTKFMANEIQQEILCDFWNKKTSHEPFQKMIF